MSLLRLCSPTQVPQVHTQEPETESPVAKKRGSWKKCEGEGRIKAQRDMSLDCWVEVPEPRFSGVLSRLQIRFGPFPSGAVVRE